MSLPNSFLNVKLFTKAFLPHPTLPFTAGTVAVLPPLCPQWEQGDTSLSPSESWERVPSRTRGSTSSKERLMELGANNCKLLPTQTVPILLTSIMLALLPVKLQGHSSKEKKIGKKNKDRRKDPFKSSFYEITIKIMHL